MSADILWRVFNIVTGTGSVYDVHNVYIYTHVSVSRRNNEAIYGHKCIRDGSVKILKTSYKINDLRGVTVEPSLATQKICGRSCTRISAGPLPGNSLGQAAQTRVSLSLSSIIWYWSMGSDALRLGR